MKNVPVGSQPRIHKGHGGHNHAHPHMAFHAPAEGSKNAGHFKQDIHSQAQTKTAKHVIPVGHFGEADRGSESVSGGMNPASPDAVGTNDPASVTGTGDTSGYDSSGGGGNTADYM